MARALMSALVFSTACATGVAEEEPLVESGVGGSAGANSSSSASASSSSSGAGGDGGAGGSELCDFTSPNSCAMPLELASLAGDQDEPAIVQSGTTSKWFKIHVTEEVGSVSDADMSYTVTLASPEGVDYDLFVHQGPQDGGPDCGATAKEDDHAQAIETVSDGWDDDQGIGGEDDSLWLVIEVRHVSGNACGEDDLWSLTIEGNT